MLCKRENTISNSLHQKKLNMPLNLFKNAISTNRLSKPLLTFFKTHFTLFILVNTFLKKVNTYSKEVNTFLKEVYTYSKKVNTFFKQLNTYSKKVNTFLKEVNTFYQKALPKMALITTNNHKL